MDVSSLAKLVPSTDGVIETNAAFKLFDNQLFAPDAFTFQQLPLAVSSPSLLAEPWQKLSAQAQQPSCGMSDDLTRELQRALEHRHSMLTTYKHLTADLWTQLQQVLDTSELLPVRKIGSPVTHSALQQLTALTIHECTAQHTLAAFSSWHQLAMLMSCFAPATACNVLQAARQCTRQPPTCSCCWILTTHSSAQPSCPMLLMVSSIQ
jgi:hypothetical protein